MTTPINFEKSLSTLEEIVMKLEKGDLPLADSLKEFEHGINLAHNCQEILKQAEQKIELLVAATTNSELVGDE